MLQLLAGSAERLGRYRHCLTAHEGSDAARALLRESLDELVGLVAPYDPWDVVELLRVRCTPPAPAAGQGSDPEATAALVELVAVVVAGNGRPAAMQGAAPRAPLAVPVIDRVHRLALDCLHRGSEAVAFQATADAAGDALARVRVGATLREMTVRNQVYPHMLRDTLRMLFGTPEVEADCRAALGFTVADAMTVLDACCELRGQMWGERMAAVASTARLAAFITEAAEHGDASDSTLDGPRELALASARKAVETAWSNPADAVALNAAQLARHTGLPQETVTAVLDVFTLEPHPQTPQEAALAFLSGTSALRMTPLLRDECGRVLLVHDALHLPAIRETFEQRLKDANRWTAYSKHRGTYLEEAAADVLRRHLPQADVHSGFEYFVPDPAAPVPQSEPARYTKRAEGDVLVVADDIAIIVEAKAVALNPRARAGDSMRLRRDLTRIVTDAAAQAQRLRERIETDHGVRLRDGSWLDLAHVREVHTIAVSLEDLSGIVTTTADIVGAGLLPPGNLPWAVSLHDLRTIGELIARPAELILYLRRRTDTETTQKFMAVDELDLFLHFYEGGLYVEPDPDRVARELPQFGPPTVAARRRREAETATLLTSRTDRLDAWYFHQLGHTTVPVEKPAMAADAGVLEPTPFS
ncbi:preprotein translocase subunit SecA [Streptomyces sp. NPDC088816]|uniref:preprotein translocase subunit SecA n=1 Tax=Streptomyces sp. NPDC088816 TaxID=3365906 RepID=UPI00380DC0E7